LLLPIPPFQATLLTLSCTAWKRLSPSAQDPDGGGAYMHQVQSRRNQESPVLIIKSIVIIGHAIALQKQRRAWNQEFLQIHGCQETLCHGSTDPGKTGKRNHSCYTFPVNHITRFMTKSTWNFLTESSPQEVLWRALRNVFRPSGSQSQYCGSVMSPMLNRNVSSFAGFNTASKGALSAQLPADHRPVQPGNRP